MKTFRLKRRAKAYQKLHGGRIVGTTGAYQVKKNTGKKRGPKKGSESAKRGGMRAARARAAKIFHRKPPKGYYSNDYRENSVRKVKRPKGWVKASAVKIERGRVLIKR